MRKWLGLRIEENKCYLSCVRNPNNVLYLKSIVSNYHLYYDMCYKDIQCIKG